LLVESAQSLDRFELVVTVEAGPEARIQRLIEHRGMDSSEAKGRVASQATAEQRQSVADFVIDANDSLEDTKRQAHEVWSLIEARLHSQL